MAVALAIGIVGVGSGTLPLALGVASIAIGIGGIGVELLESTWGIAIGPVALAFATVHLIILVNNFNY